MNYFSFFNEKIASSLVICEFQSVRTGKISVSELMGCGDKNLDKKRKKGYNDLGTSNEEINGRHGYASAVTTEAPNHGISVDPANLLDVAGWKLPPLPPGLVSIGRFSSLDS